MEGVAHNELLDDNKEAEETRKESDDGAEPTEEDEGGGGKGDEAVDGELEEFFEVVVWLAGETVAVSVVDVGFLEAHPVDEAAGDAAVLGELVEFVDDDAVHEAEVGAAGDGIFGAEHVEDSVEEFGAELGDEAVFFEFAADAGDDFGVVLLPFFDEIGDELGGLLAVGVHGNDGVAGGFAEAGGESDFFAEVAGEADDFDGFALSGEILEDF